MSKRSKSKKHSSKHNKHQEPIEELEPEFEDAFEEIPDAEDNSDENLKDLMEKYGDVEPEEDAPKKVEPVHLTKSQRSKEPKHKKSKRPDKVGVGEPDKRKERKEKSIREPDKSQIKDRPIEKRKETLKDEANRKPKTEKQKGKIKGKPKGKEKPKTARKLKLPDKARKLPIEEADSDLEIDWSFEAPVIEDQEIADFERSRLNEQLKYIEREKINLYNELVFMKTDLEQKTQLVDELKKDYEKLRNDFDNYKKRVRGEIKDKMKFASESLILEVLDVLDNFDRTYQLDLQTVDKEDLIKGIKIIYNQLLDVLKKDGLSVIEANGKPFDPYVYEAVSTTHTDDHPHNTVLEEFQKGYKYKNKVVRATKVRVSQSDIVPEIPIVREAEKPKKTKNGKEQEEPKKNQKTKKLGKMKKDGLASEVEGLKEKEPGKLAKKKKKPEGTSQVELKTLHKHKKRFPDSVHRKMEHHPNSDSKMKMMGKQFKKKYSDENLKRLKARKKKEHALK